ncbi:MAG: hypothetical protein ACFCVH_04780 [Alphaproteobacteria bacterium]
MTRQGMNIDEQTPRRRNGRHFFVHALPPIIPNRPIRSPEPPFGGSFFARNQTA